MGGCPPTTAFLDRNLKLRSDAAADFELLAHNLANTAAFSGLPRRQHLAATGEQRP